MADSSDVLLALIKEQRDQIRQIESQRATLSNIIIVIVAAGLGLIAQRSLTSPSLVITLPMTCLGAYGILACLKYHERSKLHGSQAHQLRLKLADLHPDLDMNPRWTQTFSDQQQRFPRLYRVRLYLVWVALHAGICLGGLTLTMLALSH
ncbi:hypothetical protein [Streptomyces sp. YGL11-2]|uniref:hypothetical protein n=1 Tax=Streptomyces sp. YGL11-2 TaxID=3414028 RepID=UPI003CF2EAD5